ncbi:hypothetical protein KC726_02700 [Candidatus Woesebacteria bacterium]|nr:hypothetical protein [Candidatus Woesebacteria bacterium]
MARVKLTEYKAKKLLFTSLKIQYEGYSFDDASIPFAKRLSADKKYVVKVDQGVKGRMKKGLVVLQVEAKNIAGIYKKFHEKGYGRIIVEPQIIYNPEQERYLSIERIRTGFRILYSRHGGIHVEDKANTMQESILPIVTNRSKDKSLYDKELHTIAAALGIQEEIIRHLHDFFTDYYCSFLEVNPFVLIDGKLHILDLAIEVDSTARFFARNAWSNEDIASHTQSSEEEQVVQQLNDQSQAALSLTLLNPRGTIWLLLSGGGASLTIADEFYNLGHGKELGNYGEYSGNPNEEETYLYTKQLLNLAFKSNQKKIRILIGGGVANFTDVRTTFRGIAKAFEEQKTQMKKHQTRVFVRRGGPHEAEGLSIMKEWLSKNDMLGVVSGPEIPLNEIVKRVINQS